MYVLIIMKHDCLCLYAKTIMLILNGYGDLKFLYFHLNILQFVICMSMVSLT